jgi:hypothetical protein
MSPKIILPGRTQASLKRLKKTLREQRRRRDRLAREHELALRERGREARRRASR